TTTTYTLQPTTQQTTQTTTTTPTTTTTTLTTTTTTPTTTTTTPTTTTTTPTTTTTTPTTTPTTTTTTPTTTTTTPTTTTTTPTTTTTTPTTTTTTPTTTTTTPTTTTTTLTTTTTTPTTTTTTPTTTTTTSTTTTTTLTTTTTTPTTTTTTPTTTTTTPTTTTTIPSITTTTPTTTTTTPTTTTTTPTATTTTPTTTTTTPTTTTTTPTTTTTIPTTTTSVQTTPQNTVQRVVTIRILVVISVTIDLSNTQSQGYQTTRQNARAALFIFYRNIPGFIDVIIFGLRRGSLVVDHRIVTEATEEANAGVTNALVGLASGDSLTYDNQSVQTSEVILQNDAGAQVPITTNSEPCALFTTALGGCSDGQSCLVVGGNATCVDNLPTDGLEVIIGLGVGVSAIILFTTIVLIWMCIRTRTKRKHETKEKTLRPPRTFPKPPTRFQSNVPSWSHQPTFYHNKGLDLSEEKFVPTSLGYLPSYNYLDHEKPRKKRDRGRQADDTYYFSSSGSEGYRH
ncbi:uncharacterized protein, partial [Argopecten irradians]|uniref:uncharacterized protein n=1 Tax=Argopecten irradians TaxID=31199 RepID=UPI00371F0C74